MNDEKALSDEDPFAQEEEDKVTENLITEPMVKKVTYLIHKLAKRRGSDFKDIQTKCKHLFGYQNLAKVSLQDGHAIITKLIELTGGEEEKPQLPTKPDDELKNKGAEVTDDLTKEPDEKQEETVKEGVEGDDMVTFTMRKAIRAAVDITIKEVVDKNVPVQGLGGFVLEIGKVIFEAKMRDEASE
jgi:hypothetical protein